MEIITLSGLVNGIVALAIGVFVVVRNRKIAANRIFALFALSLALWSFGYWQWLEAGANYDLALTWATFKNLASMVIPVLFFHCLSLFQ